MNKLYLLIGLILLVLFGCGGGGSNNSTTTSVNCNLPAFVSETKIVEYNFNSNISGWEIFYIDACTISQSTTVFKSAGGSLKVSNRKNNYDGPFVDISRSIKAGKMYVVRGYVKRGSSNTDTYILNAKIGFNTYKELNRVLVDNDDWTKFRAFITFSQTEIDSGVKLYINSLTYKDDYYLDDFEIVETNYNPNTVSGTNLILQTSGDKIKNCNNNDIRLKGVNFIAYSDDQSEDPLRFMNYSWYNFDKDDFQNIKGMGFNSVRLALWYKYFEDDSNPYNYKQSGFDWLNFVIGWAKEAGVYIVLDMHAPQCGGFQGPEYNGNFWDDSTCQDRFKKLWYEIASSYRNEPTIAAFDIMNEPCAKSQNQYINFLRTVMSEIRTVDNKHILNVEVGFCGSNKQFLLSGYTNVIYDFHFYDPWSSYTDNATSVYNDTIKNEVINLFNEYADFYKGYPFQVSEFGQKYATFSAKNAAGWVSDLLDLLSSKGASYHYFSYKGNEFGIYTDKNAFSQNSSKNQVLIDILRTKQ